MLITRELSKSGDPSEKLQEFKNLNIRILCCRYWWFDIWKGKEMAYPFWRLYWNKNEGAYVYFKKKVQLLPKNIYLIPPNTPFSNGILEQELKGDPDYFFKCGQIRSIKEEQEHLESDSILHFFIHFTLGRDYGGCEPGIYCLELDEGKKKVLEKIVHFVIHEGQSFNGKQSLWLYYLLTASINELPSSLWKNLHHDKKLQEVLLFMEMNLHKKLTDSLLAEKVNMGTSTFVRFFKKHMRNSPSKYLSEIRLKHAAEMLSHTDLSIEDIAQKCGFTDRYHLSRLFPKKYGVAPAAFRKRMGYY